MKKIILILLAFSLFSCGNNTLKEYHSFSDLLWEKTDVVNFDLNIEKTGNYNIYLPLRYTSGCPYKSILINVKFTSPSGKIQNLSKEITILDNDNNYVGDGSGDIWDTEELAAENYKFDEVGKYKIELSQATSEETLAFIMEVGIRINQEKLEK